MKKQPKKIIIHRAVHQPSMHVIGGNEVNSEAVIVKTEFSATKRISLSDLPAWFVETSIGSLLVYLLLGLSRLALVIFRLPRHSQDKVSAEESHIKPAPSLSFSYVNLSIALLLIIFVSYGAEKSFAQIKTAVSNNAEKGVFSLIEANKAWTEGDILRAQINFAAAETSFQNAQNQVKLVPGWMRDSVTHIPYLNAIAATNDMLELSESIAELGQQIVIAHQKNPQSGTALLTAGLLSDEQTQLNSQAKELVTRLQAIDADHLPINYSFILREAQKNLLPTLSHSLSEANDINTVLKALLGMDRKTRFFLAFQNNNEIRATGGFLGSFAIIDTLNGEIVNIDVPSGGTYDVQGQQTANIAPPPALSLVSKRWELQDANWWIDWPTSARQIATMYESAGGSSVDGVIAFDTTVLEAVLELTGPIELKDYGMVLSSENVIKETQYHVEVGHDSNSEKPKQIISNLTPLLLSRLQLLAKEEPLKVATVLLQALKEKRIQFYSNDDRASTALSRLNWNGSFDSHPGADSLAVVHTNIAGQKTDAVMENFVDYSVTIDQNGVARGKVVVTRKHGGVKGDLFTGVRNVNYMRVYVPKGSTLITATGFKQPDGEFFDAPQGGVLVPKNLAAEFAADIDPNNLTLTYNELGHTVFANWLMTDPGETSVVTLTYRLPLRLIPGAAQHASWFDYLVDDTVPPRYHFKWTQQPGLGEVRFKHALQSAIPVTAITSSAPVRTNADGWDWTTVLNKDIDLIVDLE